jgi:hypothetical protein
MRRWNPDDQPKGCIAVAKKKIDLYRQFKQEYVTPKTPVLLSVKPARYLSIDGQGAPGGEQFSAAIGALYAVAFTIKMTRKFSGKQDYAVSKLEGFWHLDGDPADTPRKEWRWTLAIRTPSFVTRGELTKAISTLLARRKPAEVKNVRLEQLKEGACVHMLHVGPYERESETIEKMRAFARSKGRGFTGAHHEIYLSDPRRVPAARLRTILRQPVQS